MKNVLIGQINKNNLSCLETTQNQAVKNINPFSEQVYYDLEQFV